MSLLVSIIGIAVTVLITLLSFVPEKHWKYLSYVARHKAFVFRAGLATRAPLWRLLIHDWSKFLPSEWFPYVENFYGAGRGPFSDGGVLAAARAKEAFERAWLHHIHANAHHWNHWVLRNDDGTTTALPMPEKYIREMVADWFGAGRAISGKWEAKKWYQQNAHKMTLDPGTRQVVEFLVARTQRVLDRSKSGREGELAWWLERVK